MSPDERLQAVLLAQKHLGPVFPLWGVVGGPNGFQCECGNEKCDSTGKHPRIRRKLANQATYDPGRVKTWFRKYPNANYAVRTGENVIVVDVDLKDGTDGLASLAKLEGDCGQTIPATVTVASGRNNGSKHIYFVKPEGFSLCARTEFLPGVDMKGPNQYVVAPGSRHVAGGGYYHFDPGHEPGAHGLAELPDFLLSKILDVPDKKAIAGVQKPRSTSEKVYPWDALPEPGELRPDAVVLGALKHDRLAGPLYRGRRLYRNASENDMVLAGKLAFYTCHHFDQAMTLFFKSALYRDKFNKMVNNKYTYAEWTIRKAFYYHTANWIRSPRKRRSRATGAKRGRKISAITQSVLELHRSFPDWTPTQLASALQIMPERVRSVLHRLRNGRYRHLSVTQFVVTNTQEEIGR
jgi:hypothetical protein